MAEDFSTALEAEKQQSASIVDKSPNPSNDQNGLRQMAHKVHKRLSTGNGPNSDQGLRRNTLETPGTANLSKELLLAADAQRKPVERSTEGTTASKSERHRIPKNTDECDQSASPSSYTTTPKPGSSVSASLDLWSNTRTKACPEVAENAPKRPKNNATEAHPENLPVRAGKKVAEAPKAQLVSYQAVHHKVNHLIRSTATSGANSNIQVRALTRTNGQSSSDVQHQRASPAVRSKARRDQIASSSAPSKAFLDLQNRARFSNSTGSISFGPTPSPSASHVKGVTLFKLCNCWLFKRYCSKERYVMPRLDRFPGSALEFFNMLAEIRRCRGHSSYMREECGRLWDEEARRPDVSMVS